MRQEETTIDASRDGGQIVRTSIALSSILQQPVRLIGIRRMRPTPGLRSIHVAAVDAAARITQAEVTGNYRGSMSLSFRPCGIVGGTFEVDGTSWGGTQVGSAVNLVQLLLPVLAFAGTPSRAEIVGATHMPGEATFEFLDAVVLPQLKKLGIDVAASLRHPGSQVPGQIDLDVIPAMRPLAPMDASDRGPLRSLHVSIAVPERLAAPLQRRLATFLPGVRQSADGNPMLHTRFVTLPYSDRAIQLTAWVRFDNTCLGWCRSLDISQPETTALHCIRDGFRQCLASIATVDPYAADTLLPWLTLCQGRSRFTVNRVTNHLLSLRKLLNHWYGPVVSIDRLPTGVYQIVTEGMDTSATQQEFSLKSRIVVFHGGPGSGKSRFSRALAIATGAIRIAVGERLRDLIRNEDPALDQNTIYRIQNGEPAPNRLVYRLIDSQLNSSSVQDQGVLLDGFPRTASQARWLARRLQSIGVSEVLVVALAADPPSSSVCNVTTSPERRMRRDDRHHVSHRRWSRFRADSEPLLAFCQRQGIPIVWLNPADKPKFQVLEEIAAALRLRNPGRLVASLAGQLAPYLRRPALTFDERSAASRLATQLKIWSKVLKPKQ